MSRERWSAVSFKTEMLARRSSILRPGVATGPGVETGGCRQGDAHNMYQDAR